MSRLSKKVSLISFSQAAAHTRLWRRGQFIFFAASFPLITQELVNERNLKMLIHLWFGIACLPGYVKSDYKKNIGS